MIQTVLHSALLATQGTLALPKQSLPVRRLNTGNSQIAWQQGYLDSATCDDRYAACLKDPIPICATIAKIKLPSWKQQRHCANNKACSSLMECKMACWRQFVAPCLQDKDCALVMPVTSTIRDKYIGPFNWHNQDIIYNACRMDPKCNTYQIKPCAQNKKCAAILTCLRVTSTSSTPAPKHDMSCDERYAACKTDPIMKTPTCVTIANTKIPSWKQQRHCANHKACSSWMECKMSCWRQFVVPCLQDKDCAFVIPVTSTIVKYIGPFNGPYNRGKIYFACAMDPKCALDQIKPCAQNKKCAAILSCLEGTFSTHTTTTPAPHKITFSTPAPKHDTCADRHAACLKNPTCANIDKHKAVSWELQKTCALNSACSPWFMCKMSCWKQLAPCLRDKDCATVIPFPKESNGVFSQADIKACAQNPKCRVILGCLKINPYPRKYCHSVGDPHVKQFDGTRYDSHDIGWKVLYKYGQVEIQVEQVKWSKTGTGVAINRAVRYSTNGGATWDETLSGGKVLSGRTFMFSAGSPYWTHLKVDALDYRTKTSVSEPFSYNVYVTTNAYLDSTGPTGQCMKPKTLIGRRLETSGGVPFPIGDAVRVSKEEAEAACAMLGDQKQNCITDIRMANDPDVKDLIKRDFVQVEKTVEAMTKLEVTTTTPAMTTSTTTAPIITTAPSKPTTLAIITVPNKPTTSAIITVPNTPIMPVTLPFVNGSSCVVLSVLASLALLLIV